MEPTILASLLYETYREILYITCHYQEEFLTDKEVAELSLADYKNLAKSKVLKEYAKEFADFGSDMADSISGDFIGILSDGNYNEETMRILIAYLNPFKDRYLAMMHEMIDKIADVLDIKMKERGYQGSYPVYIKIEENKAIIERAILSTNAGTYLAKKTRTFGFKVTYVVYNIPLKAYTYNGVDLRGKEVKEIVDAMDASVKVSLENAEYYDTDILPFALKEGKLPYSLGELSIYLDKRASTGGVKSALKESFKRTIWSFLAIIVLTIVFLIIKYFIK